MRLWNPAAFFISLMMSIIMPVIFGIAVPHAIGLPGLEIDLCLYMWPLRWVTAYLLINIIVYPIGFGLAEFALPMGLSIDLLFYMWPLRWVAAYLLINIVVYPIGFALAKKVFGFDPMAQ